jgi:hypothetical protein
MNYQFEPFDPSTVSDERPSDFILMEGEASFEITEVLETESKQGNKQTRMSLSVTDESGKTVNLFDYFPHSATHFARWKIKQFAQGVGDINFCKNGMFSKFLVGKKGKCIIKTKKEKGNDKEWSMVDSYVKKTGSMEAVSEKEIDRKPYDKEAYNDEIPF